MRIFILFLIALVGLGVYFGSGQYRQKRVFEVVIKENSTDKNLSDIYLKNNKGKETFFMTLSEIYRHHYHPAEYHDGNLYIIRRTGGEEGFEDIPDWTDELWKYSSDKQGTKLSSSRGLDFRVSDDGRLIAVVGSESDDTQNVVIIDNQGGELVKFAASELEADYIDPLVWGKNSFWLVEKALPVPIAFISIDKKSFEASKFSVNVDDMGIEYALNPDTQKLAYSDYPPLFDVDSAEEFRQSSKKVTLFVYDLSTDEKKIIDTSIVKEFNPKWIDDKTLEYDNPVGDGRLRKKIRG